MLYFDLRRDYQSLRIRVASIHRQYSGIDHSPDLWPLMVGARYVHAGTELIQDHLSA